MSKEVLFLYFGRQCPGNQYMGEQAEKLSELLGMDYRAVDIGASPELAARYNLFFPGTIVIEDFQLVYPGTPEQMAESYRQRRPLPGKTIYEPKPPGQLDSVELLTPQTVSHAFCACIPSLSTQAIEAKVGWVKNVHSKKIGGLVGYADGRVAAFVEMIPEPRVPYPIGDKKDSWAFVTCLYSPIEFGLEYDYRTDILKHLMRVLPEYGFRGVSIVSGVNTPYPNGPEPVLAPLGFKRDRLMGKALLRHSEEEAWLLRLPIK